METPKQARHPSFHLTQKAGNSTRSLPADVTTTRLNIASDGTASTIPLENTETSHPTRVSTPNKEAPTEPGKPIEKSTPPQSCDTTVQNEFPAPHSEGPAVTEQTGGWLSWIYRPGPTEKDLNSGPENSNPAQSQTDKVGQDSAGQSTSEPGEQQGSEHGRAQEHLIDSRQPQHSPSAQKRSWLQMWYGSAPSTKSTEPATVEPAREALANPDKQANEDVDMAPKDVPERSSQVNEQPKPPAGAAKSSGWSFWSKEPSKEPAPSKPQEVEAIEATIDANTPPRPTSLEPNAEAHVNITKKGSLKVKLPKDGQVKDSVLPNVETTSTNTTATTEPQPADASASKQLQKILPNQVLPRFEETYKLEESPSLLQSLGRILHYSKGPEHRHVARIKESPRIKRALAIGVHGYFPAPFIRSVLGQPTGTSIRFSNMAAEAITKWTADHGYSCEVEKIALEGEGRISERVDLLWKLLLNWMEEIRKADFILVACHSQGVPVSIMLVAKLIAFGCLDASRVGICAMAGVNMGPFSSYRSRWISGSAGELFEFELPHSKVSKDYEAALRCALDFGVRISYIGSIDDQLVSLEV